MSVHVFYKFFYWTLFWFSLKLNFKSSLCNLDMSYLSAICKYFFFSLWLVFSSSLTLLFVEQKFLILIKSNYFFFRDCGIGFMPKNSLPSLSLEDFLLFFSQIIFVWDVRFRVGFNFFACRFPVILEPFLEKTILT